MEEKTLKERLEEAQKAVSNLEEPFKKLAFEKILNSLFVQEAPVNNTPKNKGQTQKVKKEKKTSLNGNSKKRIDEETQEMINKLNRTEHTIIKKMNKAIDLSMYILKVMEEKGYNSLTPSQIADILLEVFKKKITKAAVGMALLKADEYIDRDKTIFRGAVSYKYRLVDKGEDYINSLIETLEQEELNNQTGPTAEEPKPNLSSEVSRDNSEVAN